MKKLILGAAAVTLLLSGCTKNDILDAPAAGTDDGKIRFSGTTGLVTKAAPGNPFNSTADLQKYGTFNVSGYVGTTALLINETVTFNGTSWEYTNEPYWPNSTMDFYAHANWGTTIPAIQITPGGITAKDVSITPDKGANTTDDYKQTDLLVAATFDAQKQNRTLLTFKHALTQVVFKAANITETTAQNALDVYIGAVEIVNVGSKGDMSFLKADKTIKWTAPAAATPAVDIIANSEAAPAPAVRRANYSIAGLEAGDPTALTNPTSAKSYEVARVDPGSKFEYTLYPRVQSDSDPNNNALILLPQNFPAWDPVTAVAANSAAQYGAYIHLKAIIKKHGATEQMYYYCGTTVDGTLATDTYGDVYIPIESLPGMSSQWIPGKRINYIITFGEKDSGSGGGGYDNNGDPILVPIRFRAVVEDWVETNVPLLTATIQANSAAVTNKFITGYVNQLLSDVKAASSSKVYLSKIIIGGDLSSSIGTGTDAADLNNANFAQTILTTPTQLMSSKFLPGSTLEYNLEGINDWNDMGATLVVPVGWEATSYHGSNLEGTFVAGATVTIDGAIATHVVLTKLATNGTMLGNTPDGGGLREGYNYWSHIGFVEDHFAAVELNENGVATANKFNNTIKATGAIPVPAGTATDYVYNISTASLENFVGEVFSDSKLTVDMTGVTGFVNTGTPGNRWVRTWVPNGWTATLSTVAGVTYLSGEPITLTEPATIVFTKSVGVAGRTWMNKAQLDTWLAKPSKTDGETFYYNNVDFNVAIDFTALTMTGVTPSGTAKIQLKYPITDAKATATGNWGYDHSSGVATYTEP